MNDIELTINSITDVEIKDMSGHNFQGFPIDKDTLQKLQHNDIFCCKNAFNQIKKGNIQEGQLYIVRNNILKRYVTEGDSTYETTVMTRALIGQILRLAHDELGHNNTHRTYTVHKRLYYWKGQNQMLKCITKHVISIKGEINR